MFAIPHFAAAADDDATTGDGYSVYQPSDATRPHYERLLALLRKAGADNFVSSAAAARSTGGDGGSATATLEELADDVIDICHDTGIAFADRRARLEDLTGVKLSADVVRAVSQACEKITDYVQSAARQDLTAAVVAAAAQRGNAGGAAATGAADDTALAFAVGDALARSAWHRRGGAAAVGADAAAAVLGSRTSAFDAGGGDAALAMNAERSGSDSDDELGRDAASRGGAGGAAAAGRHLFHPATMEASLLSDALTRHFPDIAPRDRAALEADLRGQLADARRSDAWLRTDLPLRLNPDGRPAVAAFVDAIVGHRWHIAYGLRLADAAASAASAGGDEARAYEARAAVLEELRAAARAGVAVGDVAALELRRRLRAVLALVSKSERDRYDEEDDATATAATRARDAADGNAGDATRQGDVRTTRRGAELNVLDLSLHHPMGRHGGASAAQSLTALLVNRRRAIISGSTAPDGCDDRRGVGCALRRGSRAARWSAIHHEVARSRTH
jgi:hypothetical protein